MRAGAVLGAATVAAACSSAAPPADATAANDLVINPVGSEHESNVTFQLPTDACLPGATCAKILGAVPSIYIDGVAVALGAKRRLKPGTHNVAVNTLGWQLTTVPDQTQVLTLPVVDRKCTNAALPNVPVTNFGGGITVSNAPCPTSVSGTPAVGIPTQGAYAIYYSGDGGNAGGACVTPAGGGALGATYASYCSGGWSSLPGTWSYKNAAGACVSEGTGAQGCLNAATAAATTGPGTTPLTDAYQAFAPGTLTANVNGSPQTLTVNLGDEADFNLSLPAIGSVPPTFTTQITFADPRANVDAAQGTITSSCAGDRSYTIPSATGTPAPLALTAFVNSSCVYTLTVAGIKQVLDQTTANAITLHRLDVNAVTITREDGTTYTVTGTYTLNSGGIQVAGPYNTSTGIDVLPGTYQFSLNFTDFDGPQTQTQTITF
jgi:hypothetical protein